MRQDEQRRVRYVCVCVCVCVCGCARASIVSALTMSVPVRGVCARACVECVCNSSNACVFESLSVRESRSCLCIQVSSPNLIQPDGNASRVLIALHRAASVSSLTCRVPSTLVPREST
jgi:hypothetical protein